MLKSCFFLNSSIADIPMSVGIIDPRANPTQLNTVEFLWDPSKRTSVFIQVFNNGQLLIFSLLNLIPHLTLAFSVLTISLAGKSLQLLLPSLFYCLWPFYLDVFTQCRFCIVLVCCQGTLHQHRIHHAKARRRKGRAFPHPDRHVQRERERRVHRTPPLCLLPGQSL